jgi:hypothetical protein
MNPESITRQFSYHKTWDILQLYAHQSMMLDYMYKNKIPDDCYQQYLSILYALNEDIQSLQISTCSVCGDKHHTNETSMLDNKHIIIQHQWSYFSNHDNERHTLILCSPCYTTHIMDGFLGKFVKVEQR